MQFLRTNTATRVTVGPFLDKADGVTPETSLTVTNCKLTFVVDDGGVPTLVLDTNPTASGGANDMVHITGDDAGYYDLELAAGNVNYLGRAKLCLSDAANHCPVFQEFMILPAVVYDAMILGTDNLDVSVTQFGGTNGTFSSGRPEVNTTHLAGSAIDQSGGLINANVKQISGDATAADNLESYTDGTTPMPVNMTQISGDATAADNLEKYTDGTEYMKVDGYHQKFSISGDVITPKHPDGSDAGYTRTYGTDAGANPIVSSS